MQKTYSLRAECLDDVIEFEKLIREACATTTIYYKPRSRFPDQAIEIQTSLSYDEILVLIRNVPDGHVMLQTLQSVPLSENSLERDYDRE